VILYKKVLDEKQIKKLASLARMEVGEKEVNELQKEMESVLGYVEQISEIVAEESEKVVGEHRNIMRDDDNPHKAGEYTKDILKEAPSVKEGFFEVKKIL